MEISQCHLDTVSTLSACLQDQYIVSGSWDHTAILWDLASLRPITAFQGHSGAVRDSTCSSDGRIVLTAGDTSVRLWDRASGRQVGILKGHFSHVTCVDIATKLVGGIDDGYLVLSGSYDCSALVWDLRLGVPIRTLVAHTAPVTSCCFARDCSTAITAGMDRVCRIFDLVGCHAAPPFTMLNPPGRSKHLRMIKCSAASITRCRLSPDGNWLATAAQDGVLGITKVRHRGGGVPLRALIPANRWARTPQPTSRPPPPPQPPTRRSPPRRCGTLHGTRPARRWRWRRAAGPRCSPWASPATASLRGDGWRSSRRARAGCAPAAWWARPTRAGSWRGPPTAAWRCGRSRRRRERRGLGPPPARRAPEARSAWAGRPHCPAEPARAGGALRRLLQPPATTSPGFLIGELPRGMAETARAPQRRGWHWRRRRGGAAADASRAAAGAGPGRAGPGSGPPRRLP